MNNKEKFSVVLQKDSYQKLINNTLKDPKVANRFIASISSAVANNSALQECTPNTILTGALTGEALGLSPSPTLGQYYLVPFNNRKAGTKEATFILGAKGYIQLAIRSGQYQDLGYIEIREGEFIGRDPFTGKQRFKFIENEEERLLKKVIGYMCYFELNNGFKQQIYWSKQKMMIHADKYSMAFSKDMYIKLHNGQIPEKDLWKYSSYWYKDFDGMAFKTLIRQIISKFGVMSIEFQEAYEKDTTVIRDDGTYEYVDNQSVSDVIPLQNENVQPVESDEPKKEILNLDEL